MNILQKAMVLLCMGFLTLWTMFCALGTVVAFFFNDRAGHWVHRTCFQLWLFVLGIDVRWEGLENLPQEGNAVVLAPNHESMFDIMVMAALPFNFRWISKQEVGRIPFIGWAMTAMGCYFVRRGGSGQDLSTMAQVEEGLRDGRSVLIFPEGTRTRTGDLLPFKKGAFKTAQNAGVPMLPVAITGTRAIAPAGGLPDKRGHRVTIRIGEPYKIKPLVALPQAIAGFREALVALRTQERGSTASPSVV